jgi:hypothetical protein
MSRKAKIRVLLVVGLSGCATQVQLLDQYQGAALGTARSRAGFELSCPQVEATVLSRKIIEPIALRGIQRYQYTVGVSGCGKKVVYWTMCVDQSNCNALADTGRIVTEGQ